MRSLILIILLIGTAHGFLGPIGNLVTSVGDKVTSVAGQVGQTASNLFNGATNHISNIGDKITSVAGQVGQTASNLFNGATNQANNVIGNVVDKAGNVYGQLVNTVNGIQFTANFLWDNVFGPSYDLMIEGGKLFLDDNFGNIIGAIGRRSALPETILSEKYSELTARFKSNIHKLYDELFQMEKEALIALQKGEKNLEDKIRSFYQKINSIQNQINQLAAETKYELEMHALTVKGDWINILNQYTHNIDLSVKGMRTLFQQLVQDLMKNFVELAVRVVPDGLAILENMKQQGLLSFLKN